MNTVLLRQVADRIDPETRAEGIAGYSALGWGELREECLEEEPTECNTVACIAGHAVILHYGVQKYMDYVMTDNEIFSMDSAGMEALELTREQKEYLFYSLPISEQGSRRQEIPRLLREYADEYEAEQNERA